MKIPKPMVTREHGSWAVLLIPMAIAAGSIGEFNGRAALVILAALGGFMSYVPLHAILRGLIRRNGSRQSLQPAILWAAIYLAVGVLAAAPLLVNGYWWLVAIGAIGSAFFALNFFLTRQVGKTAFTDFVAVAGLTLGAPAMYYVLTGLLDRNALILYLLNLLFFGCSVFYVHMKIRAAGSKKAEWTMSERIAAGGLNLAYLAMVTISILLLSWERITPSIAIVAFTPMILHALYGTYRLSSHVSFSRLGVVLLVQSIVFGLLWISLVRA